MRKIPLLLAALALFSFELFASTHPKRGCFAFDAEYLYMLNCTDQPYFAQKSSNFPSGGPVASGERFADSQKWHSGYRLEGIYGLCPGELHLRWTHFPTFVESRNLAASSLVFAGNSGLTNVFGTLQVIDTFLSNANIRNKFDFYSLEGLFEYPLVNCSPVSFWLEGGIHYAHIGSDERVIYLNTLIDASIDTTFLSKRDAIGLEMGFDFEWNFLSALSFNMRAAGSLLTSRKHSSLKELDSDLNTGILPISTHDGRYWVVFPAADLRAGFCYCRCLARGLLNLEVGYEFLSYFHSIDRILSHPDADLFGSQNKYRDFTLQGLYVRAGYAF